jgi:hypothetical protein
MKIIQIFFLLVLFNIVIGETCTQVSSDVNVDKCKAIKVDGGHCCYYEKPKSEKSKKGCYEVSDYEYKHIDVLVKYYQTFGGDNEDTEDKDAKLDCNSQSLKFSLIFLILLFI